MNTHKLPVGVDEPALFRALFVAYPDALLLVDLGGLIALANPAAAGLLGYEAGELEGMTVDALVPDAIRPRHASYRDAYAQAPRTRPMGTQMELVARRKDGSEVMVEIALSPLQSHGVPLVVAAIRGIGAYPRVLQALQRARYSEYLARLGRLAVDTRVPQVLLDQVPQIASEALEVDAAIVYLLESTGVEFAVASAAGSLGSDVIGERRANMATTLPGYVFSVAATVSVPSLAGETRFTVHQRHVDAGIAAVLAVPLMDRGRVVGVLAVLSVRPGRFGADEERFLESLANLLAASLQRAQNEEALNHAQRLESVGQLTGGIAHDFNNLLTVIQGNLQVLEELPTVEADARGQQLVGAATRATRRAAELTNKLLAFSRRQVLQPAAVDIGTMLHSLADMLRRTLDQHIGIEVEAALPGITVVADPGQLESALLNIAINARDAMPTGGSLSFAVGAAAKLPVEVRRELGGGGVRGDDFVEIRISDTGAGMSDAVKERAFEPFFTTKEAGRGTGLGLSTVYGFVKQSKGAIAIDSAPGAGTTISMYLPSAHAHAHRSAGDGRERDGADIPAGLRVLLVEDDAEVRAVVCTFCKMLGCAVTPASTGEQALALLVPEARFDLLLTDIALGPGIRGTALAAEAQRRFPALGILLMSGFSSELLDADRDSPNSWELLRKPYTRAELAQAIARVIASR